MSARTPWIYSQEHGRYYYQFQVNGQWQTVWQEDDTTAGARGPVHNRVDSGTDKTISGNRPPTHINSLNAQLSYPNPGGSTTSGEHGSSYEPPLPHPWVNAVNTNNTYLNAHPSYPPHVQGSNSPTRGEGPLIEGSWTGQSNQTHETLDPSYYVRHRNFFTPGRVISVLFTENAGTTATPYNDSISYVRFSERVFTQIRRFVVVRQKREFCYACPIFTYSGRATTKPGIRPDEHSVIHTNGCLPLLLQNETGITKDPIAMDMAHGEGSLDRNSRLRFGIHHPIQYNVKVKDHGMVCEDDIQKVIGYWNEEQQRM